MIDFELNSGQTDIVNGRISFRATDNGFPVECAITTAALIELSGTHAGLPWRDMFELMQAEVFDLARAKYEAFAFEADGSILIASASSV